MRALRHVLADTGETQDGGAPDGSNTDTAPDTDTATVQDTVQDQTTDTT